MFHVVSISVCISHTGISFQNTVPALSITSRYYIFYPRGEPLPYVGGYQVPVNRPPFLRWSHIQGPPFFLSPHPMTPFFPLSYQILHTNCKCSRALRAFWEIYKLCRNFNINLLILARNCIFAHLMTPIFWSPHQKRSHFFWSPHGMTPFFSTKSYSECPLLLFSGRHL